MYFKISYKKKRVMQALRLHFIAQKEIRILFIIIILFDVISGILYFAGKIQPAPFLLGAVIWFFFLISFWFLMPGLVYKRSGTFRDAFTVYFQPDYMALENDKGRVEWEWRRFVKFFESNYFFHLYFSEKSFFLVPKDDLSQEDIGAIRSLVTQHVKAR